MIIGENGSGKSAYAERLVSEISSGAHYYAATMIPFGDEGAERVEKHKGQRAEFGFITVEKPVKVSEIHFMPGSAVLLEDVSNLLSNVIFEYNCGNGDDVFEDITAMCSKCACSVLVSIGGLAERAEYDDETRRYINELNRLNRRLYDFAGTVIEMRDKAPVIVKGEDLLEKALFHAADGK